MMRRRRMEFYIGWKLYSAPVFPVSTRNLVILTSSGIKGPKRRRLSVAVRALSEIWKMNISAKGIRWW